jgi:eukaryotic-like serine/threonine-protein kinase
MIRRATIAFLLFALLAVPAFGQTRVKLNGKTYVTTRSLGGGRWGTAYEAKEEGGKRKVAIKIPGASDTSDGGHDTFNRELRVMTALKGKHPSLPKKIYGIGSVEGSGKRALVMELYDAAPVGQLSKKDAVDMAVQLLEGVEHLHAEGYWHADITPGNVLRDNDGRVYLIDYGRVRKINEPRDWQGWAEYSAPEVLSNTKGQLKDIYSIGKMLGNKVSSAGGPLQSIIAKATHKDPNHRFQTAGEFRDALLKLGRE